MCAAEGFFNSGGFVHLSSIVAGREEGAAPKICIAQWSGFTCSSRLWSPRPSPKGRVLGNPTVDSRPRHILSRHPSDCAPCCVDGTCPAATHPAAWPPPARLRPLLLGLLPLEPPALTLLVALHSPALPEVITGVIRIEQGALHRLLLILLDLFVPLHLSCGRGITWRMASGGRACDPIIAKHACMRAARCLGSITHSALRSLRGQQLLATHRQAASIEGDHDERRHEEEEAPEKHRLPVDIAMTVMYQVICLGRGRHQAARTFVLYTTPISFRGFGCPGTWCGSGDSDMRPAEDVTPAQWCP